LNFGLESMRIVDPRDGWPNPAAEANASGAERVLEKIRIFDDVASALSDMNYVLAATARKRNLAKDVVGPGLAIRKIRKAIDEGSRVALMFGPERSGLENRDIAIATSIITFPVNPEFPSLNLSQSVLLMGYEWWSSNREISPPRSERQRRRPARFSELQSFAERLEARLDERSFFHPSDRAKRMRLNLRNMLFRMPFDESEIRLLHGILKSLTGKSGTFD